MTLTASVDRATTNGKLADISVRTHELEWVHFGGGIEFKLLRVSPENGTWATTPYPERQNCGKVTSVRQP